MADNWHGVNGSQNRNRHLTVAFRFERLKSRLSALIAYSLVFTGIKSMGMYNDFRGTKREGWVYTYTGQELLAAATAKQQALIKAETDARNECGNLLKDTSVSANDQRLEKLKQDIEKLGNQHEQCDVFVHEFTRNPSREYHLSLGDVTYFDLHKHE